MVNPLNANPTKWSITQKQFVSKLLTNCLSLFDHFVGLVLKGLNSAALLSNDKTATFSSILQMCFALFLE